jgi:dethiobiotin synthetase
VIVVVTGTGTEIGKTWVTANLAHRLRAKGLDARVHKPVQSFAPGDERTDAHVLADAVGALPEDVCPPHRWLPIAMAPPIAAGILDRPPFTIADLVAELPAHSGAILFVEGAGGVRSPLACDGDIVDFVCLSRPDHVLLVADAGLGTINLVRLSIAALPDHAPCIVFLNRFDGDDEVHVGNDEWLRTRERLDVVTDLEALAESLADRG